MGWLAEVGDLDHSERERELSRYAELPTLTRSTFACRTIVNPRFGMMVSTHRA